MPDRRQLAYAARGVASRGASIVASFAMTWIILASLPPERAGRFVTAYAILLGTGTVVRFGIESLLLKLSAADPQLARPYARPAYVATVGLGLVGTAALFAYLAFYLRGVPWWAALAMASGVVAINLALVSGALLRGTSRITSGSVAELGSLPALVFGALALARLAHWSFGLGAVCVVFAGAAWLTAAWSTALAVATLRRESAPVPPRALIDAAREHGTSLRQFMITGLGYYLFANVPLIVLGGRPTQSAHFNAARTLANLVATVPAIQISYLSPQFAHLFHHGELDALNRLIRRSTRAGAAMAALLAAPLLVLPGTVLHIYKPEYADAALTLQILAGAVLLQVVLGPVQGLLVTCGFERQAARITLAMLLGGTVLMVAVARWGASPVAAANSLANLGFVIAGAVLLRRREGIVSPLLVPLAGTDSARPPRRGVTGRPDDGR